MSMEINGVSTNLMIKSERYTDTERARGIKKQEDEQRKAEKEKEKDGVLYEKGTSVKSGLYSINMMSEADRSALVDKLKAETESRKQQMLELVHKTLSGQVKSYGQATGDGIWKILAGGNFTVDAATKAQAQKDISEDGYWGVKQTSQRLFDFASALAGDDVEKMKKMQSAMEKGFKEATGAWGRDLPSISHDTLDAANKLFEEYYNSKNASVGQ